MSCYSNCTSFIFTYIVPALLICYLVIKWKFSYWKSRGVLSTSPRNLLGDLRHVGKKYHFVHKIQELYESSKQKTRYYGIYSFGTPVLLLTDLDLVKTALDSDSYFPSGTKFTSLPQVTEKLKDVMIKVVDYTPQIVQCFENSSKKSLNVKESVNCLVIRTILPFFLGLSDNKVVENLEKYSNPCSSFPLLLRLYFNYESGFKNNSKLPESVKSSLRELIKEKQVQDVKENDLIDLAVQLQEVSTDNVDEGINFLTLFISEVRKR